MRDRSAAVLMSSAIGVCEKETVEDEFENVAQF